MRSVEVVPAYIEGKGVVRQLVELYMHDFSEFNNRDVTEHGLFGYRYLDHYWTESDRHPFLFRVVVTGPASRSCAALTPHRSPSSLSSRSTDAAVVGTAAARAIFQKYPGHWTIEQIAANSDARMFWHQAIPVSFIETTSD